ncbi:MAG: hypothetical protein Q8R47_01680 [Nanoarchaeota archaeon]|nr:hypothetical protein [Nanoarchaeota archaeon]
MEIPAIKLGLYQENPKKFAQELGQALENVGVVQVDGVGRKMFSFCPEEN